MAMEKCRLDVMYSELGSSSYHNRPYLVFGEILCSRYMYISTETLSEVQQTYAKLFKALDL